MPEAHPGRSHLPTAVLTSPTVPSRAKIRLLLLHSVTGLASSYLPPWLRVLSISIKSESLDILLPVLVLKQLPRDLQSSDTRPLKNKACRMRKGNVINNDAVNKFPLILHPAGNINHFDINRAIWQTDLSILLPRLPFFAPALQQVLTFVGGQHENCVGSVYRCYSVKNSGNQA